MQSSRQAAEDSERKLQRKLEEKVRILINVTVMKILLVIIDFRAWLSILSGTLILICVLLNGILFYDL